MSQQSSHHSEVHSSDITVIVVIFSPKFLKSLFGETTQKSENGEGIYLKIL